MKKDYINNERTVDNRTNKLFICTDGQFFGKGDTPTIAFEDYTSYGSNSFVDCEFFSANKVEVELKVK